MTQITQFRIETEGVEGYSWPGHFDQYALMAGFVAVAAGAIMPGACLPASAPSSARLAV